MHQHVSARHGRAFALGIGLNIAYVVAEAGFGFATHSLALLSDAGHNASDVLGLLIAWLGFLLARVPPSYRYTYGMRSSTILAALFNGLLLLAAVGAIVWESLRRLAEPAEVPGLTIVVVAAVGMVINMATALLFFRDREHDLNIRGAYLHMAADAAVSLGVVVAGLLIRWSGWYWIDPVTSLLIAVVIFLSTWSLLKDSLILAMHAVPPGIDASQVEEFLRSLPGVQEVHDLHIWGMSTTETALTAHLVKPQVEDDDRFLAELAKQLHDRFGIEHMTIQIERSLDITQCGQAAPGNV